MKVKWSKGSEPGDYIALNGALLLYRENRAPGLQWVLAVNESAVGYFRTKAGAQWFVAEFVAAVLR